MKPCFSNASFKQINNTIRVPTIGIVGVTIPGALDCISKINQKSNNYFEHHYHPNIILHQLNFGPTHHAQQQERWDIVENRLMESITSVANSGADFAIIPANTVHKVITKVKRGSSIPILNILDLVALECKNQNLKKVAILGTRWTMTGHLYQKPLHLHGIEEVTPEQEEQNIIQRAIFEDLIPSGKLEPQKLHSLLEVVEKLKAQGCDGVVLACTELPLVLNKANCGVVTIDTTDILAEAAVQYTLNLIHSMDDNSHKIDNTFR